MINIVQKYMDFMHDLNVKTFNYVRPRRWYIKNTGYIIYDLLNFITHTASAGLTLSILFVLPYDKLLYKQYSFPIIIVLMINSFLVLFSQAVKVLNHGRIRILFKKNRMEKLSRPIRTK